MSSEALREKVANLRRQHILEAAIRVFARHGFERATIKNVAAEAGVSDGAIYHSFASKEDLLLAVLDPLDEAGAAPPAPVSTPSSTPPRPEDIASFVRTLLQRRWQTLTPETLDLMRVILSEVLTNERLRALYMQRVIAPALALPELNFASLVDAGALRPFDVPLTLRIVTATVLGLVMLRLLGDTQTQQRWDELPGVLADRLLVGLLPVAPVAPARSTP